MLDLEKIHEISTGIDEHLRKLESFTNTLREIKSSLDELRHGQERAYLYELNKLRDEFNEMNLQLRKRGLPETDRYERELALLRKMLGQNEWPMAIDEHSICRTTEKAIERAGSILDLLVCENLKEKKFLDYGCGQGHTIPEALRREAKTAIGYDIKPGGNEVLSDFNVVRRNGPYDIILLHDVLDHAEGMDPVQILLQAKSVLANKGRIFVRNHPWSSRHGGHLYLHQNKAFMHLVFDEMELTRIGGYTPEHNLKIITPLDTYRRWFSQSGLLVINETAIRSKVEDFFLAPSPVHDRIKKHWGNPNTIVNHMEIDFVEYILETNSLNQHIF